MIYLIDNEGGELALTPNDEAYEYNDARIPLSRNVLVIFRCDAMGLSYAYRPEGRNLSLTAWVLDTPRVERVREEQLRQLTGPQELSGVRTNVMSVQPRYPGCGHATRAFWRMFSLGCDAQVKVPLLRWDTDLYWRKDFQPGFSATCHGGLVQEAEIAMFDNRFFGISEEEAKLMDPYHRCILEVGYETLRHAGHSRRQLKGFACGVFVGDTGSDWNEMRFKEGDSPLVSTRFAACTRLSCILGLTGPTSTSETACSSSLVACGVAQMTMRRRAKDQKRGSVSAQLSHSLVIGSNLLLGFTGYIALSGPGMLSREGRCFTFDVSADGYARGEGVGGVKLKVCESDADSMNRLAVLAGCAINQDGRSASLTAPNGPSQQEVIRQSFREGGVFPAMSTVAECHGTGTPLGDPIEVGALQAVLRLDRGGTPMPKTSAKTNIGHLEAAAGIAGFIKCVCMLHYSTCIPNLHLKTLNPHLDVEGYPVNFANEPLDYGTNSGVNGVSSFGFGGTNARADLWGHAHYGQRMSITGILPRARSIFV
uniref:Ketosynthase family 3 (KS3) domain-containing protein n=1 Tax=Alexandrium catenella TaxID=2925 RepID=A0A7S1W7N1_ALECA|mmetsp:Transcript_42160/g.113710  ORF Transcript_42160/g.113710 Transcript_42160/m.113710 type:complete len:538 (+) Transcript_42160:3-1616(+)